METSSCKEIKKIHITHHFFCDKCGEHLGDVEEYDDGYYPELNEFELKIFIDEEYGIHQHLCDKCRDEFVNEIQNFLISKGFKKE